MSNTKANKKLETCSCSKCKGKELIIITIETCCKKNCDSLQETPPSPRSSPKEIAPSPVSSQPAQPKEIQSSPQLTPAGPRESSQVKVSEQQRLYKLPLLVERHHGPGCAMEISVLEKHEDSCMYKKEGREGRNADDRVGSYDCIGRMVFRTCNPSELESDSSGITGKFTGLSPKELPSGGGDKTGAKPTLPHEDDAPRPAAAPPASQPPQTAGESIAQPASKEASPTSIFESVGSQPGSDDFKDAKSELEEHVNATRQEPVQAVGKTNNKPEQHHDVTVATGVFRRGCPEIVDRKRHPSGDDYKLRLSTNPLFLPKTDIEKACVSKKTFSLFNDEANQTDFNDKLKDSQATITTLNNSPAASETNKKSNFFTSLFKRNSNQSSNITESQKSKNNNKFK